MPVALLVVAVCGCTPINPPAVSPLAPPKMNPGSVVLDIFFIRVPFGDERANVELWNDADEQPLAPELRQELGRNGFRAGVVGAPLPAALSQLMELDAKPPEASGVETRLTTTDLAGDARVTQRHLQIRPGQRNEIVSSTTYDELAVLLCQPGELVGESFRQAQTVLAVHTHNEADGRVRLELVPEVHHGEPKQRWVGGQGVLRLEAGKTRRAFDGLGLTATLAPGQMLVMASLPNRTGSLGHHFFTETSGGKLQQKLLVVRLSQTQHGELLAPPDVLPLAE